MKNLKARIVGNNELRINNPQAADPLNKYAKELKKLNKKMAKNRTDKEHETLKLTQIESKLYFDSKLGIYVPSNWIMSALTQKAHDLVKSLSKAKVRAALYMNSSKIKLHYTGESKVKKIQDVVMDPAFSTTELMKSGAVTKPRSTPSFDGWSFDIDLDFDEEMMTEDELMIILTYVVTRVGFGDFRPTYGRGKVEDLVITDA